MCYLLSATCQPLSVWCTEELLILLACQPPVCIAKKLSLESSALSVDGAFLVLVHLAWHQFWLFSYCRECFTNNSEHWPLRPSLIPQLYRKLHFCDQWSYKRSVEYLWSRAQSKSKTWTSLCYYCIYHPLHCWCQTSNLSSLIICTGLYSAALHPHI